MLRVAVVEDQPLYRQMLGLLLSGAPGVEVTGVHPNASIALAEIDAARTDVVLLDLRLPDGDGISVGRELRRRSMRIGVVILSSSDSIHALLELTDTEAHGWSYLSKTSSLSAPSLLAAIRATARGHAVLDPALTRDRVPRANSPLASLSPRQREVLALMAEGLTNAAIAEDLGLSRRSVDSHVDAIYTTLGLRSNHAHNPRVDAVRAYLAHSAYPTE
jgi:DNA-binding NarL/FixJ family response regulator